MSKISYRPSLKDGLQKSGQALQFVSNIASESMHKLLVKTSRLNGQLNGRGRIAVAFAGVGLVAYVLYKHFSGTPPHQLAKQVLRSLRRILMRSLSIFFSFASSLMTLGADFFTFLSRQCIKLAGIKQCDNSVENSSSTSLIFTGTKFSNSSNSTGTATQKDDSNEAIGLYRIYLMEKNGDSLTENGGSLRENSDIVSSPHRRKSR